MKATHIYKSTGIKNTTITVKFTVTSEDIIRAISHMIDYGLTINKKEIEDRIKRLFTDRGEDWLYSESFDLPEHKKQAEMLAVKYFPSFFNH
jgi:hypothetical protein